MRMLQEFLFNFRSVASHIHPTIIFPLELSPHPFWRKRTLYLILRSSLRLKNLLIPWPSKLLLLPLFPAVEVVISIWIVIAGKDGRVAGWRIEAVVPKAFPSRIVGNGGGCVEKVLRKFVVHFMRLW